MKLQGQTAIITGGSSGMGATTARFLAKAGAKVALLDLQTTQAEKLAQELNGMAVTCDVTNDESVDAALKKIEEKLGTPRICINCAGIATAKRMVGRQQALPLNEFDQVIRVNLIGTFNVMRLAAQAMSKLDKINEDGERGVIINTASVAAYEGQIGQVAYSASKGGVVSMTVPAARELAQFGIRVVTIAPGLMDTPMLATLPEQVRNELGASIPFPSRLGKAEEYAALAIHIIENPLLNGCVIRLDGALRMPPK